ncbi:MAG: ATP synthase F1 subunit gamma [Oscillospiraceae bacterium]|jgi:ATP synthase, F1 gamma subunit|nr:ATP synthase F1 subunit gamma [Oscillospiraceae bacterium]MBQ6160302.1 ATP synthase F1 subunit gamma [Oscillospiraceae bacterium]
MAGVSMKDIKLRIKSMESTKQITKAMEMVAASKLRRAQDRVANSRPYFEILFDTLNTIANNTEDFASPFLEKREVKKSCYVVIGGDRGLAGGYNHNVFKLAYSEIEGKNACVVPIGKKCLEFFRARGVEILTELYAVAAEVSVGDCFTIAKMLSKGFLAGEFDTVSVVYTNFVSMLSQSPGILNMLPLEYHPKPGDNSCLTLYEPDSFTVFDTIIHEYLGGLIYGALCESVTSEHGARRTAMDAATKNAEEMISDLSLKYNRARQGTITQEITEIVAGAEA